MMSMVGCVGCPLVLEPLLGDEGVFGSARRFGACSVRSDPPLYVGRGTPAPSWGVGSVRSGRSMHGAVWAFDQRRPSPLCGEGDSRPLAGGGL